MGNTSPAPVTVIIRARLRGGVATARQLHDQVTSATKAQALAAGDISHRTFLNPADPHGFRNVRCEMSPAARACAFVALVT